MEVDERDLHDPQKRTQLSQQLGLVLEGRSVEHSLKSYELDETNARGQLGTST